MAREEAAEARHAEAAVVLDPRRDRLRVEPDCRELLEHSPDLQSRVCVRCVSGVCQVWVRCVSGVGVAPLSPLDKGGGEGAMPHSLFVMA